RTTMTRMSCRSTRTHDSDVMPLAEDNTHLLEVWIASSLRYGPSFNRFPSQFWLSESGLRGTFRGLRLCQRRTHAKHSMATVRSCFVDDGWRRLRQRARGVQR